MVIGMIKIVAFSNPAPGRHTHMFMCPGCGYGHCFTASEKGFNGDLYNPTLNKPVRIAGHLALFKCESFITNGQIRFSESCTHESAGLTHELPNITN